MALISKIINKWYQKNKHLFFKYKDGFFHLNFVANSPVLMMESFKKVIFSKFDPENNVVLSNTPFSDIRVQFAFLEEGLTLLNSKMLYKKNVSFQGVRNGEFPNDYYTLSFHTFSNTFNNKGLTLNSINFSDKRWIMTKPEYLAFAAYSEGCESESIMVFFNKKWFDNYIKKDKAYKNSKVKDFFESDDIFVLWPDNSVELSRMAESIIATLDQYSIQNPLQLKLKTYELISAFIRSYNPQNIFKNYKNLSKNDILRINRVEFYLLENIHSKFSGIEFLSNKFSVSPTKLKSDFKSAYGVGVFTYFRNKQMHLAKELLENNEYQVQEVAQLFGYENTSKFSKAFEAVNGMLPSKVVYSKM